MPGPYFPDPAAEAIRDPSFDSSAFVSDQNGSVIEILRYQIANPPISLSWRQQPMPLSINGTDLGSGGLPLILATAGYSNPLRGNYPATPAVSSATAVYDATLNRWYYRNNTGSASVVLEHVPAPALNCHPMGPAGNWSEAAYDLDGGQWNTLLQPTGIDCFVYECEALWTAAIATDTGTGCGFTTAAMSGGTAFGTNANRCIGFYRKSGGSGWTLKTSDGTTASESSESSDTSDGNRHKFRIEWHAKATPEARLYVDGVLKVTKTTNLPGLSTVGSSLPSRYGGCCVSAVASDTLRMYSALVYWKNAA